MSIPEEAIVAGAKAMDAYWGGRYAPDEVDELRGEVTAILEAATPYLLAPRIITTAEELDKLPAKSAILDRNSTPWVGDGDKVEPWASVCEDPYGGPVWKNSVDIELPATVLYEPRAAS